MEDQQRRIKEEEEEAIIANADTQLISTSMDVEESLELYQDNSGRDPSFNEGNFMSHNLLTSASTPICPSSAMKRLLHLSHDSSEDNRTPPKKMRTELSRPEVVDPIQDGGDLAISAQSQDSWKSHDEERHHPAEAHLKGGSFSLDNGAADAHQKSGSFLLDNRAAVASYDSHQGHIYRAGMSSDRLLDMRRSPTKEQLVHIIENLNKKIAKYDNKREELTCPSQKNELLESTEVCTKKLTFAINAVCLIEMKDEKSALIRCISLCEESHLMPATTYEPHGGSFGPHSSDADRSSSLTTGSLASSGPGPFEIPQLTHLARLQQHDSLTSSSTSSGGRHHQGNNGNSHRLAHVKLTQGKIPLQQMRLTCPRCEYSFGGPAAANHSRASSNAASPLVGAQKSFNEQEKGTLVDKSLLRDISNLSTPPTTVKMSALEDESSSVGNQMSSSKRSWLELERTRPQSLKDQQDQNSLNSSAIGRHIGSAADTNNYSIIDSKENSDCTLRQSHQLINHQNDSLKMAEAELSSAATLILLADQDHEPSNEADLQTSRAELSVPQIFNATDIPQMTASPLTETKKPGDMGPPSEPTTSWGDRGIGTPFLCLDTSSMSTDSDGEPYCFPPILDDPSIRSPYLDVETSARSRLEMAACEKLSEDDDNEEDDYKGKSGKCMLDIKNKSKVEMSMERRLKVEGELIKKGPIPVVGSRLFEGCALIFSQCHGHIGCMEAGRQRHGATTDSESDYQLMFSNDEDACPMDVHRLTRQVLAGGGQVYRRLHEVPRDMRGDLYLISDRPSRSPLYLACVLEGVPLVSYTAIIDACKDRLNFKQLDTHNYLIPVGRSDETGHRITRKPQKRQPLTGKRILYACDASAADQVTHQFWREILARMGAHVVDHVSTEMPLKVDIVVSDGNSETTQNVPVVNCNWIVHTLMHASYRSHDASPFYSLNYRESD